MNSRNLLILTVYIICVTYVYYQAYKSLGNQMTVELDKDSLTQQLAEQELRDVVEIGFKLKSSYKLNDLKTLDISLQNKSLEYTIYVDWDQSSITDFDKVTGRVIRVTFGMTDIPQTQVASIIRPGQTLKEELSNEDIPGSLFEVRKIRKAVQEEAKFSLRLVLKISDPVADTNHFHTLRCPFTVKRLRLTKALAIAMKPRKPKK